MAAFQRYIGVDYSGAATPDARLTGLRVYLAEGDGPAMEARPDPARPRRHWTRREVYEWLLRRLKMDAPTLVGLDHSFSFPEPYFDLHQIAKDWDAFLADFHQHWPSDEPEATVGQLRDTAGLGRERGGDTHWRREAEQRAKAKSVFHFNVPGSVAHSTHAGLPWLLRLRRELEGRIHFWPFDGWQPRKGVSVIAEVYPSLHQHLYPRQATTPDQHDAFCAARWLQETDRGGELNRFFTPTLGDEAHRRAAYEGWVLGVR